MLTPFDRKEAAEIAARFASSYVEMWSTPRCDDPAVVPRTMPLTEPELAPLRWPPQVTIAEAGDVIRNVLGNGIDKAMNGVNGKAAGKGSGGDKAEGSKATSRGGKQPPQAGAAGLGKGAAAGAAAGPAPLAGPPSSAAGAAVGAAAGGAAGGTSITSAS